MNTSKKDKLRIISPTRETLELEGNISYKESTRSWSIIRFKESFLKEFPQLRRRQDKFGYKLLMHRNYADLLKEVMKIKDEKEVIPILMWMCKK